MRKETFYYLIIVVVHFFVINGKLIGDHICQEERRYLVNETEYFIKNATTRNYQWCLNVPPRCSFYTTKQVNASRIIEKEVVDVVETCCPGFHENDNHYCEPLCPQCLNGACKLGVCECFSGFKGDLCDKECDLLEWGPNCKLKCTCERGICNSTTGNCVCPPGFTGDRCQSTCEQGFYGDNCKELCKCGIACHHITGICPTTSTTTTTTTTSTTTTTTTSTTTASPSVGTTTELTHQITERIENPTTFEDIPTIPVKSPGTQDNNFTVIKVDSNGKFITSEVAVQTKTSRNTEQLPKNYVPVATSTIPSILKADLPLKNREREQLNTDDDVLLKSIEIEQELPTKMIYHESDSFNDKSEKINIDQSSIDKNNIINNASAVTAMTTVIIVLILIIVLMSKYERKKNKIENERQKGCVHTVSVCTQNSAFHPTIPESSPYSNSINNFDTHLINSENSDNGILDSNKYSYDQLPSTAGNRATFMGELFDIQTVNSTELSHNIEPVYDEIPSRTLPISEPPESSSLYVNTYAKTRL